MQLTTVKISTPYNTNSHNIMHGNALVARAHYWPRRGENLAHWKVCCGDYYFDSATLKEAVNRVAIKIAA